MKILTKVIAAATLTLSSIGLASASNAIVPADDYVTTKLCIVAAEGSKMKLSKAIKETGLSKRFVVQNVKCNDLSLVNFIAQYGSNVEKMNNFLIGKNYSNEGKVSHIVSL